MNMNNSALKKGETLIDTAMTLNAMHPDLIVIRHQDSGAPNLLSQKVNCAVINAGDGRREHPTQALLDALTIINRKGKIEGLKLAICGDILHSRVTRSNTTSVRLPFLSALTHMLTVDLRGADFAL
jgi:aspartate carbamoyltransferase catalytic subunit